MKLVFAILLFLPTLRLLAVDASAEYQENEASKIQYLKQEARKNREDATAWWRLGNEAWKAGTHYRKLSLQAYEKSYLLDPSNAGLERFLLREGVLAPARAPEPPNRKDALLRSLFIPGLGQIYRGDQNTGLIFMLGIGAMSVAAISHSQSGKSSNSNSANDSSYINARTEFNKGLAEDNASAFCGYVALGLYAMNLLDAWFMTDEPSQKHSAWIPQSLAFRPGASSDAAKLSLEWTL